jgi:cation:H+ antiporter
VRPRSCSASRSTVVDALRRRAPHVAVGTLFGSNVVNPLLAVGLGAVVSTYRVPPAVRWWDLPVKLVAGVGLLAVAYLPPDGDGTLDRRDGAAFVVAYFAFVAGRLVLFDAQ